MKIQVLLNRIKVDVKDDFEKDKDYFKRHGLDVEWEFQDSDIKGYKAVQENFGSVGYRWQIMGHETQIPLSPDYITIFAFNGNEFPLSKLPSSKSKREPNGILITLMTYKEGDAVGETYSTLIHEVMHGLNQLLLNKNITLEDPMDAMFRGQWLFYYKNHLPEEPTSNFGEAWKILAPYLKLLSNQNNMYKPKNFALKELVSKATLDKYGEQSWQFLDERMLRNLQYIRETLGKPITVNTFLLQQRCFDPGEERGPYSQHAHGRAVDFSVQGMTAHQVREWLKTATLPEPNIWVEEDVGWVHADVRASEYKGVYFFKP